MENLREKNKISIDVHIYPSTLEFATRMLKVTKSLVNHSIVDSILIIGLAENGLPMRENIDKSRKIVRIGTGIKGRGLLMKIFRFMEWSFRITLNLRHEKIDMINCHSLSVLPLCVILKWLHKSILIYEPHELETETVESKGIRKYIAKIVESCLIGQAEHVIVVGDSIAARYKSDYSLPEVDIIKNVPELQEHKIFRSNSILRDCLGIPEDHIIFMYQGALERAKEIHLLLDAFKKVPLTCHLVFLGFGSLVDEIKTISDIFPNIHFHPAVASDKIIEITQGADVGFQLLSDSCLNHRYSVANKTFYYLYSGLPIIISDNLIDTGIIIDQYSCGWRVSNHPSAIADCVTSISKDDINIRKKGAVLVKEKFNWSREEEKLVHIYRTMLLS